MPASTSFFASSRSRRASRGPPPLDLEAAEGVHRLRRQAEVPHDRDLGREDRLDHREALDAALELHRPAAPLDDEARRVAHGVLGGRVVGEVRQVADDERALRRSRDGLRVGDHPVERGAERVGRAVDDHLDRVADEEEVDPRGVEERGRRGVVGGEGRDLPAPLERAKAGSGEPRSFVGFGGLDSSASRGSRLPSPGSWSVPWSWQPPAREATSGAGARACGSRESLSLGGGRPSLSGSSASPGPALLAPSVSAVAVPSGIRAARRTGYRGTAG